MSASVVERLLLTPEEVAEALAIGRSKVYELIGSGRLESVRIGVCRRVPVRALDQYVERLCEEQEDESSVDRSA